MNNELLKELNNLGVVKAYSCDKETYETNENLQSYKTNMEPIEYYIFDLSSADNIDITLKCKQLKELRTIRYICVFFATITVISIIMTLITYGKVAGLLNGL